ncbi:hypothetical protein XENOCAPTIV_027469, partial [Xenoophorus captivus]
NSSRTAKGSSSLDRLYSRKLRKQLVHHKQQLNLLKAKQKALVEQIEKEKIQSNKGSSYKLLVEQAKLKQATSKVLARIANATRPTIHLCEVVSEQQLERLLLLLVGTDFNRGDISWGGAWAQYSLTCMLQDILAGLFHLVIISLFFYLSEPSSCMCCWKFENRKQNFITQGNPGLQRIRNEMSHFGKRPICVFFSIYLIKDNVSFLSSRCETDASFVFLVQGELMSPGSLDAMEEVVAGGEEAGASSSSAVADPDDSLAQPSSSPLVETIDEALVPDIIAGTTGTSTVFQSTWPISSTWYDYWGADYGTYGYNPYIGGVGIPVSKPSVAPEKPASQCVSVSVSQAQQMVSDPTLVHVLVRFLSSSSTNGMSQHSSQVGPTATQAMHEFLSRLQVHLSSTCPQMFSEFLLKLIHILSTERGPFQSGQGPLDAQVKLLEFTLEQNFEVVAMATISSVIESITFLVHHYITCSDKVVSRSGSDSSVGARACFGGLFANIIRPGDAKAVCGETTRDQLMFNLLKLVNVLVQLPLSGDREFSGRLPPVGSDTADCSVSDEEKVCGSKESVAGGAASSQGPSAGVADLVLANQQIMSQILSALGQCNSSAMAMIIGASGLHLTKHENFHGGLDAISVGDGLFTILTTLSKRASSVQVMLQPILTYMACGYMGRQKTLQTVKALLAPSHPVAPQLSQQRFSFRPLRPTAGHAQLPGPTSSCQRRHGVTSPSISLLLFCSKRSTSSHILLLWPLVKAEVASAVCLRLHRPRDASTLGLSQIKLLGLTAFGNTSSATVNNPFLPSEDQVSKTRIQALLHWVYDSSRVAAHKMSSPTGYSAAGSSSASSREYGLLMPSPSHLHCVAAILWHSFELPVDYDLPGLLNRDLFELLYNWSMSLPCNIVLKKAVDSLLCSMCHIHPSYFTLLMSWMKIVSVPTASHSQAQQRRLAMTDDGKKQHDANANASGLTDDSKHARPPVNLSESQLTTLAAASQSPGAIEQLLDSGLPSLLVRSLVQFCVGLLVSADLPLPAAQAERRHHHHHYHPPSSAQHSRPALAAELAAPVLQFLTEVGNSHAMKDWLGGPEVYPLWTALLFLLCHSSASAGSSASCRPLGTESTAGAPPVHTPPSGSHFSQLSSSQAGGLTTQQRTALENATVAFFLQCISCHPNNQRLMAQVCIVVTLCLIFFSKPHCFRFFAILLLL